jgi:hypothetical protein
VPLRRAVALKPSFQTDPLNVRFPMVDLEDKSKVVWAQVSDLVLRDRAFRDRVKIGLDKASLFAQYRIRIEELASDLYDQGAYRVWPDGMITVRIPNGML